MTPRHPMRDVLALVRGIIAFGGRRLALVAALAVVAALAQGVGLLLLVPMLHLLGIAGSPNSGGRLAGWIAPLGLEGVLALYVVLVTAVALVARARGIAVMRFRLSYMDDLRRRLHDAVLAMEWQAFGRLRAADLTHALLAECNQAAFGVEFLLRVAVMAVEVPLLLGVAMHLSPLMTTGALMLAAVAALMLRPLNRRTYALSQAMSGRMRALHGDAADDLSGMRVIKSFGLEAARRAAFAGRMADLRALQIGHQRATGTVRVLTQAGAAAAAAV
ncbi:MAG TPA: ABC transporter transmembrane domain-containing protein, partial [Azospirillum sp.]